MTIAARPARADALSLAFAKALSSPIEAEANPPYASIVGVEHEFAVRSALGTQADFRELIHGLGLDGRRLDPGDANAYRCPWGGSITADGREAELATPPIAVRAGFSAKLIGSAAAGRAVLAGALPAGMSLHGYSTHVSVAVPDAIVERVARLYAERFAAPLMLLMDRRTSPGLLVRPRPGRLELCGEYVDGERLAAVAAFAIASVRLTCRAVSGDRAARNALPPRVVARIVPAAIRRGWYIDRRAFGVDLYSLGRRAWLRRRFGRFAFAQSHLEQAWWAARAYADDVAETELERVDRLVTGSAPLAIEVDEPDDASRAHGALVHGTAAALLAAHRRPGFRVRASMATWDFTVFTVSGRRRLAYASVPRQSLAEFFERLDGGHLDRLLASYLDQSTQSGRTLASNEQARTPGLHDVLGDARKLLPSERPPVGGPAGDRPGKRQDNQSEQSPAQPASTRPPAVPSNAPSSAPVATSFFGLSPVLLVAAGAALVILAVTGALVLGGALSGPTPAAVAPATQTAASTAAPATTSAVSAPPSSPPASASPVGATCPAPASAAPSSTGNQLASVILTRGAETYATDLSGRPMLVLTHQSCAVIGGAAYHAYQWHDVTGSVELAITLPEPPVSGSYSTGAGSLGLSVAVPAVGPGPFSGFQAHAGVGAAPVSVAGDCSGSVAAGPAGGLSGTVTCSGIGSPATDLTARFSTGGDALPTAVAGATPPAGSGRTILQLGQSATRDGRTITPTAVSQASVLCFPGDSPVPNYTPPGCKKGDGSEGLEPPALLVDVTYCVAAGAPAVSVAGDTFGQVYELEDIFVGSQTQSTGLADGANTAYYGGEVSEHALDGTIEPGECETGYLPFQGEVGQPYLQWGDSPYTQDAVWWALTPGTSVVPSAGACTLSAAQMQGVAERLIPPNSQATTSRQGLPSVGDPDGWDDTFCGWTVYADGKTKLREAEQFWDDAMDALGATVDEKDKNDPFFLNYSFSNPTGSISAVFNVLADGSTDADIEIHSDSGS